MQTHHEILMKQNNPNFDPNSFSNAHTIRTSSNDVI